MSVCAEHMTKLQRDLYKEIHGVDGLSRTFQSSAVYDPLHTSRISSCPSLYLHRIHNSEQHHKCPWGRARSYAGDAAVWLPSEHRPKCEPPLLLQKTHKHFGSGANPHPRGIPASQSYQLTVLKKSNVRWNDELLPRPTTTEVQKHYIRLPFPQDSPLSSHLSRQAMFPQPDNLPALKASTSPTSSTTPPPVVLTKAMGHFGRWEVVTPQVGLQRPTIVAHDVHVQGIPMKDQFFRKHEVISQFNTLYPSRTPTIRLPIQKLRKADWKVFN